MKFLRNFIKLLITLAGLTVVVTLIINIYMTSTVGKRIISTEDAKSGEYDCIVVLGAGLRSDGTPSDMLYDRVATAVKLYQKGVSDRILMSGDHADDDYDEVTAMKQCAIDMGVPSEDIYLDHDGYSTYDSIYRAKNVYKLEKFIVVTQQYHLYRALYIAGELGVSAYGVSADLRDYSGRMYRVFREILARDKDFISTLLFMEKEYRGEIVPIFVISGDATNER
ncbi:MAG: YdcF family protein [Clostridia bacterium]|nr:YdcF family protein [Clostridia bacterium]